MMFRHVSHVFLFLFSGLCGTAVNAQDQIIPRPVSVKVEAKGAATPVKLDEGMRIICKEKDGEFRRQAHLLQQFLSRGTGLALDGAGGTGIIRVVKDAALKQYGPEAYRLEAAPGNIVISAATPKGVYYAGQSLAQMLPAAFFNNDADKKSVSWNVAEKPFSILDYPRFAWRAFMLDEARHFFGEEEVKRLIDQMGLLKMNVLHWHLSDDAGWRIQIKKYPKLTSVGGKRRDTEIETWGSGKYEGRPHEGFYTQEQVRRIVRYAADRNITIVPEIDIPGHSAAAIVSYPELKLSARPLAEVPVSFNDGAAFDPTSERTYQFLGDIMTELAVERVDLEHDTIRFLGKGGRMHEAPLHRDVRPIAEKAMREGRSSLVKLPGNASKQWCQFFDDLGMPDLSFHCTRVTVVTRLARAGFSEGQCMQYVGHASELVHAIYRKLKARDVAQLGDVL